MKLKNKMMGNTRPTPVWLWFFAVFAVSSFVALLMYLDMYEKGRVSEHNTPNISRLFSIKEENVGSSNKPQASPKPDTTKTDATKKAPGDEKAPSFDFYSLLPKMEVLVPETEITSRIAKDKLQQTPSEKSAYFLQAGAFKDMRAADRMKAGLALLGVESRIESVTLDSGVWHRVRVGPFNDTQQMNKVRSLMKANNVSSIVVKVNS